MIPPSYEMFLVLNRFFVIKQVQYIGFYIKSQTFWVLVLIKGQMEILTFFLKQFDPSIREEE